MIRTDGTDGRAKQLNVTLKLVFIWAQDSFACNISSKSEIWWCKIGGDSLLKCPNNENNLSIGSTFKEYKTQKKYPDRVGQVGRVEVRSIGSNQAVVDRSLKLRGLLYSAKTRSVSGLAGNNQLVAYVTRRHGTDVQCKCILHVHRRYCTYTAHTYSSNADPGSRLSHCGVCII